MLRLRIAGLAFVLLCAGCGEKVAPPPERETLEFDFGTARQDALVKHTFTVENKGVEPRTVKRVQTTCGCTAATLQEGTVIAPGEKIDVPVEVNLHGKTGPDIESRVTINFAGGVKPTQLVMKGKLANEYPDVINLEKFKRGEQPEEVVTLATFEGQPPLEVTGIEFNEKQLAVSSAPGQGQDTVEIRIQAAATAEFGSFAEKVVVHTNDAEVPDKNITVRGHVLRKLEGTKNRLVIYPEKEGELATGIAEFTSAYGEPIENVSAKITKPKRLTAAVEPGAPEGTVRVRVSALPAEGAKRDYVRAKLTVMATVGGTQEEGTMEIYLMPVKPDVELPDKRDDIVDGGKR